MRRILLLNTDLEQGGTPTVIRELAVRLALASSAQIEVACLSSWGPAADPIAKAGIQVTALNAGGVLDFDVARRLHRLIRDHRIDTVFSFLVHANTMAALASLASPHVRFLQAIQTTQSRPRWHWPVQAAAQFAAERIVVPSESVAEAARDRAGIPREKIVVIPNAIDPCEAGLTAARAATASRRDGDFRIGFLGRLDPVKRIGDLVRAMPFVRVGKLHIFGAGEEQHPIEKLIAQLNLGDRAFLRGATKGPAEALAQMDLLVLPSQAEGFPLVLIEAMLAGVPIVATDAPGIRDVIRHAETGLLVPIGAPSMLANAINSLIEDGNRRQQFVQAAKAGVMARFTWDRVLPQYMELLQIPPLT